MDHFLEINCEMDSKGKPQGQQLWNAAGVHAPMVPRRLAWPPCRMLKNHFGTAELLDTREM